MQHHPHLLPQRTTGPAYTAYASQAGPADWLDRSDVAVAPGCWPRVAPAVPLDAASVSVCVKVLFKCRLRQTRDEWPAAEDGRIGWAVQMYSLADRRQDSWMSDPNIGARWAA